MWHTCLHFHMPGATVLLSSWAHHSVKLEFYSLEPRKRKSRTQGCAPPPPWRRLIQFTASYASNFCDCLGTHTSNWSSHSEMQFTTKRGKVLNTSVRPETLAHWRQKVSQFTGAKMLRAQCSSRKDLAHRVFMKF